MKVAFHAINGVGLGHVVRTTSLAIEMRKLVPAIEILVVTNAGDTSLLDEAGLDYVQLPPRLSEPHADPNRSTQALPQVVEEAAIFAAFESFGADLVVFDTHAPMAVVDRLPSIDARAVLVQRELRPEALRSFMASNAALSFDRIVIPHEPNENESLADLQSATFVGAIVREMPRDVVQRNTEAPLIVAMAGGGGQPVDAERYVHAVADAHLLARARIPNLETILVVGPYGAIPKNATYPGLEIRRSPPDLARLLAAATLVVSQAGYNAIAEVRALEKPAILVPGYRKAEDQHARAKRLSKSKCAVLARSEARSIANQIEKVLLTPHLLAAMQAAHRQNPLVRKNREAAEAVLRPIHRRHARRINKVALVAHDFAPKLGGMETVAASLATSLSQKLANEGEAGIRRQEDAVMPEGRDDCAPPRPPIDVRVYTTNRLGSRTSALTTPLYPAGPAPWRIDLFGDLLLTIDQLLRDLPDVIHLCHAGLGAWIPALRAAFPALVITANVHGNDLLTPWVRHDMEAGAYRKLQVDGLSQADAVFCVSSFSRELALRHGVAADRLVTVENGIDHTRFFAKSDGESLRARIGLSETDEVLLTVSRLAPRKGHRTALRALAHLATKRPRLKYVFTGASDTMRAELMQLARALGIASRVLPIGFVPDSDLPALYRLADVFALLADTDPQTDVEGFGVALLEAAASGLPTIATRTGGMPEAIADGETGILVPPNDSIAAADAIERLLGDRSLAQSLGEAGRRRVIDRFTQNHATDRILNAWRNRNVHRGAAPASASVQYAPNAFGNGAEIVRVAQRHAAKARDARANRRETLKRAITRDQIVRIRATGDGARLLPDVLEDCAALDHLPHVEVKLRKFLEPDFIAHALPHVSAIDLTHGLPHPATHVLSALQESIPAAAIAKVKTVRLYLTPAARTDHALAISAVPEAHALRRFFAKSAVTVVPPPELMRYLSDVPAGAPETGMIEPTNLCNLGCPTCPTGTGKIKPLPQMTIERFDHILDALAPLKNGRMRNLALWNYGEPLLNRALPAMIDHAKKAGIGVVKVSSNVHFLDGDRGRALLGSGLDVLILSVDGASQETYETFRKDGDFAKVASAVAWLCAEKKRLGLKKPRIELQFIVMRHNEHELPEMRRLASEWGVDKLRVKTVGAEDEGTKSLVPVSRLLSRYEADGATPNVRHAFCTMAWDHTVVNVDGSITPCCYLRPDMGDQFVMGNIFETDFANIWRGEKYRAFRESMLGGRADMPICNKCRGGTHDLVTATEEVAQQQS